MNFMEWMLATGLSENSANKYLTAIQGSLTNWATRHGLTTKQIADISDVDELTVLIERLSRTTEFINRKGRGLSYVIGAAAEASGAYRPASIGVCIAAAMGSRAQEAR